MKELLQQYAAYNCWAHQQLSKYILALTPEQAHQPVESSFKSIYLTVLHLWDAESIWWQRLKLKEQLTIPSEEFNGPVDVLYKNLLAQSTQWKEWIDNATEAALQHEFIYQNSKKEHFKQPVYQMLQHMLNHGTYHRGQLITLLRQVGVQQVPATDFIVFTRQKR